MKDSEILDSFLGSRTAVLSPTSNLVVSTGPGNTALIWQAATGRVVVELRGHTDPVQSVLISPDGNRVLTTTAKGAYRIWEAATGQLLRELTDQGIGWQLPGLSGDGS